MRVVQMKLGDELLNLTEYLTSQGKPAPEDAQSNDRWFQHIAIIVSDMDEAYARLKEHHVVHISPAPQTLPEWNPNASGISAFYFKDPDGHPLEILHFPEDKGNPKWHRVRDKIFLGIDHTAIAVDDTQKSLKFYQEALGFEIAGSSENYGVEQERLNNVKGAHLRITSLKSESGPAIEFLEYLSPDDGRPFPPDEKANDLIHWQTTLIVNDLKETYQQLIDIGVSRSVSRGIITLPDNSLGFRKGLMVRDPDGHVMQIVEK